MSRIAVVTGAASGNGTAIVSRFLADGYRVAAVDINTENLEQTRERHWSKSEDQVLCLAGDVSSEEDTRHFVDATLSRWNAIDILVNNAGITGNETAMELHSTDIREFDKVIAVNVRGIFLGCKFALPHMLDRKRGDHHQYCIRSRSRGVPRPGGIQHLQRRRDPVDPVCRH